MVKVITYGTYDLFHLGHQRLLERAKALGDYLIVGVTADGFDKIRGKINVQQSLMERVEAVRATGIADEIIVEEYEGQKIDDIRRYDIDIFTVGSDWAGKFDYLNEYCKVVYLERTQGVSSTELRSRNVSLRMGLVGDLPLVVKHLKESGFVNGIHVEAVLTSNREIRKKIETADVKACITFEELLDYSDAVYIASVPEKHYEQIRLALEKGKHVLVESPIAISSEMTKQLFEIAKQKNLVLMEAIKTAYSTAYSRLLLLIKTGVIGKVMSINAVCTSLKEYNPMWKDKDYLWSCFEAWAPTVLLPVYQIMGTEHVQEQFVSCFYNAQKHFDRFTKINLIYPDSVATVMVGEGIKSEGQLIISGTKGYIFVPAPWWKTDYFEVRYEDQTENKRYFYQLDGEGIRYEVVAFVQAISRRRSYSNIEEDISVKIADIFERFLRKENLVEIGGSLIGSSNVDGW